MNNILLTCSNLSKSYLNDSNVCLVLNNITFNIKKGEMMTIIGRSGSGKSTLLHIISGLDIPDSGNVFFLGKNIHTQSDTEQSKFRNIHLGFIYQFHHLLLDFSAVENIALPLLIQKKNKKKAFNAAHNLLSVIGLSNKATRYPFELSGGERQRIAIARALITRPTLIIADEPTSYLDSKNAALILNIFIKYNICYNTTFLIATHEKKLYKNIPLKMKLFSGQLYSLNKRKENK